MRVLPGWTDNRGGGSVHDGEFPSCVVEWAPRTANYEADTLAIGKNSRVCSHKHARPPNSS